MLVPIATLVKIQYISMSDLHRQEYYLPTVGFFSLHIPAILKCLRQTEWDVSHQIILVNYKTVYCSKWTHLMKRGQWCTDGLQVATYKHEKYHIQHEWSTTKSIGQSGGGSVMCVWISLQQSAMLLSSWTSSDLIFLLKLL